MSKEQNLGYTNHIIRTSMDPYVGTRGRLAKDMLTTVAGQDATNIAMLAHIAAVPNTPRGVTELWQAGFLLVSTGDYEVADEVISQIWPSIYVTPDTPGFHPKDLQERRRTDPAQAKILASKDVVRSMMVFRRVIEDAGMSPTIAARLMSGISSNDLGRVGSFDENRALKEAQMRRARNLGLFGVVLSGFLGISGTIPPEAFLTLEALAGTATVVGQGYLASQSPRNALLEKHGVTTRQFLDKQKGRSAKLYPQLYDLHNRRLLRELGNASPQEVDEFLSRFVDFDIPKAVSDTGVLDNTPVSNIPFSEQESYTQALLEDKTGRLQPLSSVLTKALVLEETKTNNRRKKIFLKVREKTLRCFIQNHKVLFHFLEKIKEKNLLNICRLQVEND